MILESLNYMTVAIVWLHLHLRLRSIESQEKMFKTSVNAATPLSFNVFFLENPSEYPHKLTLPETRVPAEALHR